MAPGQLTWIWSPARRASGAGGALLAVIKIAAAGAEQRQSERITPPRCPASRPIHRGPVAKYPPARNCQSAFRRRNATISRVAFEPGRSERARVKLRAQYPTGWARAPCRETVSATCASQRGPVAETAARDSEKPRLRHNGRKIFHCTSCALRFHWSRRRDQMPGRISLIRRVFTAGFITCRTQEEGNISPAREEFQGSPG